MPNPTNLQQSLSVHPKGSNGGPFHKTLAGAANLANLLPTGTTLAFQALTPSFTHCGACHTVHKYLTSCLVAFFALVCFLSSFTDSFKGADGKLYYGIATPKGLYVFNIGRVSRKEEEEREGDLTKYRMRLIDFVHALVSLLVFLVFALGDPNVLSCFFGHSTYTLNTLLVNLPLGVGALSSFLFMLFPTMRRGIGYADFTANNQTQ